MKLVIAIFAALFAFVGFVFGVNRGKFAQDKAPKSLKNFCRQAEDKTVATYNSGKTNLKEWTFEQRVEKAGKLRIFAEKEKVA